MVLARAAMGADLNSLEGVIRHTKRTILYFHPLDDPAPIKRVWCTTGGILRCARGSREAL